jgi:hypothetical protein
MSNDVYGTTVILMAIASLFGTLRAAVERLVASFPRLETPSIS